MTPIVVSYRLCAIAVGTRQAQVATRSAPPEDLRGAFGRHDSLWSCHVGIVTLPRRRSFHLQRHYPAEASCKDSDRDNAWELAEKCLSGVR